MDFDYVYSPIVVEWI